MIDKQKIGEMLKERAKQAWQNAGHGSGIRLEIRESESGIELWGPDYGEYMSRGVRRENIPFYPGSGRKESKYIKGLMRYAESRIGATDEKEKKSIAFAIAYKQKFGSPGGSPLRTGGEGTKWLNAMRDQVIPLIQEEIAGQIMSFTVKNIHDTWQ